MTPELARAARSLLAAESGDGTSTDVAARAEQVCKQLSTHLARLLGENGVRTLFDRSVKLARATFPWLVDPKSSEQSDPCARMRTAMELQTPEAAMEAFVLVLSTFVALLSRLIGEGLVTRVLHELWPAIFPYGAE